MLVGTPDYVKGFGVLARQILAGVAYKDGIALLVYDDERQAWDRMRAKDAERIIAALERIAAKEAKEG